MGGLTLRCHTPDFGESEALCPEAIRVHFLHWGVDHTVREELTMVNLVLVIISNYLQLLLSVLR